MSAPTTKRSRKKAEAEGRRRNIRERLLAAIKELAAAGESYSAVSVERLASTAGLSRATFYIYFDGKAGLLESLFAEVEEEFTQAIAVWLALDGSATQDELGRALRGIADVYVAHRRLLAAFNDEASQNTEVRDRLDTAIARVTEDLQSHIEQGQKEGWIDAELLPGESAAWLVATLERGLGNVVADAGEAEADLLLHNLASMIWHVLYVGSPAHPNRTSRA